MSEGRDIRQASIRVALGRGRFRRCGRGGDPILNGDALEIPTVGIGVVPLPALAAGHGRWVGVVGERKTPRGHQVKRHVHSMNDEKPRSTHAQDFQRPPLFLPSRQCLRRLRLFCENPDASPGGSAGTSAPGSGGITQTGGLASAGGTTDGSKPVGGTVASGGTAGASTATGGAISGAGTTAPGGTQATGGTNEAGGTTTMGGTAMTGGSRLAAAARAWAARRQRAGPRHQGHDGSGRDQYHGWHHGGWREQDSGFHRDDGRQ